jgi:hypothetical protein
VQLILSEGMPEVENTFIGQRVIVGMIGTQTMFGGCCTACMLPSVSAAQIVYATG